MTTSAYANIIPQALAGNIKLPIDATNLALLTSAYTPNFVTDVHWADISSHEAAGTGYTTGGLLLAHPALTLIQANSWAASWAAGHPQNYADIIRPSAPNGYLYMAANTGTTGGHVPTWPTVAGASVTDGTISWVCLGSWATVYKTDPAFWSSLTLTARYAVLYDTVSNVLLACQDFGSPQSPAAQPLQVSPDPVGGWLVWPPL